VKLILNLHVINYLKIMKIHATASKVQELSLPEWLRMERVVERRSQVGSSRSI